jgi:hypothetical protein
MAQKLPLQETLRPPSHESLALIDLPEAPEARAVRPAEVRAALASYLRAIRALGRKRTRPQGAE